MSYELLVGLLSAVINGCKDHEYIEHMVIRIAMSNATDDYNGLLRAATAA
jgi:hypothetical protein